MRERELAKRQSPNMLVKMMVCDEEVVAPRGGPYTLGKAGGEHVSLWTGIGSGRILVDRHVTLCEQQPKEVSKAARTVRIAAAKTF